MIYVCDSFRTLHLLRKGGKAGGMGWQPMSCLMRAPAKKNGKKKADEDDEEEPEGFIPFSIEEVASLAKEYSLCVGGEALADLIETGKKR